MTWIGPRQAIAVWGFDTRKAVIFPLKARFLSLKLPV
jgi:hypothetical protein